MFKFHWKITTIFFGIVISHAIFLTRSEYEYRLRASEEYDGDVRT